MIFKNKQLTSIFFIVIITGLAFVFRFTGLKYGIPTPDRGFSIHPDEFLTVETAFEKVVKHFSLDVGFYNYPSLYIFVSGLFMMFGITYGGNELGDLYYYARIASAVMGALSVPAIYYAGCRLFDEKTGLIAALTLALAPLHIILSHFSAVDVPSSLFIAIVLLLCGIIIKKPELKYIIAAGAVSGLAAGTKYNCVLVFLSVIASVCLSDINTKKKLERILLSGIAVLVVFLVTTPGAIVNFHGFWAAIMYEKIHTVSGHSNVFEGLGSPFLFNLEYNLFTGFGALAVFISLIGLVLGLVKKNRSIIIISSFVIPYYIFMSLSKVNFSRYMLPIYPALALGAAYTLKMMIIQIYGKERINKLFLYAVIMAYGIGLIFPAQNAISYFRQKSPQDKCTEYISHIPVKAKIGVIDYPWFYSPAYSEYSGYGTLNIRQKEFDDNDRLVMLDENSLPDYVVLSDYEYYDSLRLWQPKKISENQGRLLTGKDIKYSGKDDILRRLEIVSEHYRLEKSFDGGKSITLFNCPHDMCYINPQIYVFKKKY